MTVARHARPRRRDERGYAATLVAFLAPVVFIALSAIAVDTSRWYVEMQRVQNAADAGALAGVTYMPQDIANATSTAKAVASRNGYTDGAGGATVTVAQGDKSSQLKVTVTSTIKNVFGQLIGTPTTTVSRTAVADFTGPAPMGSPCNTFGNEPNAGTGTPVGGSVTATGSALPTSGGFANCKSTPDFWATVEGPETGKVQGDRYQTKKCESAGVDGCDASKNNTQYSDAGYFWIVKVQPSAVGKTVDLELYDPEFASTGQTCGDLPGAGSFVNNMNDYVTTDGKARYGSGNNASATGAYYCTGDSFPGAGSGASTKHLMTTSFSLRQQTDTLNPLKAPIQNNTSGSPCVKQYTGQTATPSVNDLKKGTATYDDQLAQTFHNWTSLCSFTPARAGDYYLHVRTNVSTGGTALGNTGGNPSMVYTGNANAYADTGNTTTGEGSNSFGIRALTPSGSQTTVAVSGYDRMPIYANADAATSTFNLIRVLPGAAGQYISFSFFDAGDASSTGSVTVLPPSDATGSIISNPFPGSCKAVGGNAGSGATLSSCSAPITNTANNGKAETMSIPIPADYTCNYNSNGGCWYQVQVKFTSGAVHDVTTWDATIVGDPVRLVK
jgi:Flp pilus assembly protein TadG